MRILVVGGGGREHALLWAIRRELSESVLFAAPGNAGTAELATNLTIAADRVDALVDAVERNHIDLTVVGPEVPLALGLADRLRERGRDVMGPGAAAAQIEASKAWAKEVMAAAGVPTARSATFRELSNALAYVDRHAEPLVVKASGLAAGKGAVVCATRAEARDAVRAMLGQGRFGDAGGTIVIEDFLEGEELSVLAITSGTELQLLPPAQDHKRLLEGDTGPNTGGMGAYSPVSLATPELLGRVERDIFRPVLTELERRDAAFSGVLYAGLMIDPSGAPSVIEFNCRLGDPETQVILPRVTAGLVPALAAAARGEGIPPLRVSREAAVTTVLASGGYPDRAEKGAVITVEPGADDRVLVFHAGTHRDAGGMLRVAGGRVFSVTGLGVDLEEARGRSLRGAAGIHFDGQQLRRDIGWRELARQPGRPLSRAP